jgi:hypothetical protein
MDMKQLLALLDKHVNQEALAKDIVKMLVLPWIEEKLKGVDIIPGTELDQLAVESFLKFLKEKADM